ncbi:MAG: lyase family protein [Paracoccus sp. (in: a-proteobacteria)]|uniref:lyase family protein n=1 Tax=Paracoccus sp. TaxID=267 RepID=UPI0026DFCF08|nr:lyase family protein [Paracoccus sp. (in: a-proteobacteria)]MDO5631231.1 lyase family protein [Paracoccus sp. (in: a-proteobacteria)]
MILDGLFGDAEIAALIGDQAQVVAIVRFEQALARVQARMGIIPDTAARAIAAAIPPDPAALIATTARAGIAAQAVVAVLKSTLGDTAPYLHFGATSQDAQDSAAALQWAAVLDVLAARIAALDAALAVKAADYADQPIPARTRFQIAAPTTLGAKIAVWRAPLRRHLDRLAELRPRLLTVSLFGAAGTGAALADMAAVRVALAAELGLADAPIPTHATRDAQAELGAWLALVSGTLGKIGTDLILLGQSEIGEVSAGTGGGSSTMPQKSNPVAAEALVTLARLNAGAVGTLFQALVHAQERDGAAMAIEWLTLPDMAIRTGAALRLAQSLVDTLRANPDRIKATFDADQGAMLAEAAGFLLARDMPRPDALAIVAQALQSGRPLADALTDLAPGRDWHRALDPAANTGAAGRIARINQHIDQ